MTHNLPQIILNHLLHTEIFCRKSLPHIKPEYFEGPDRVVYELILEFIQKYNELPTTTVLEIELRKSPAASRSDANDVLNIILSLADEIEVDQTWLIETTEKWCKDRAVHLAVMESISIIDGKSETHAEGAIPDILSKALSVTFDTNVGHDYLEDGNERFEFYTKTEDKLPFDLEMLNDITNGGVPDKTLNIILAGCVHPDTPIRVRLTKPVNPS